MTDPAADAHPDPSPRDHHHQDESPFSADLTGISAQEFWDEHYGEQEQRFSGRPNVSLIDLVAELAPGTALDLGAGEGGDAIYLAGLGWQVTAVDVSATALARLTAAAEQAGVASLITIQCRDLAASFPAGTFDLVSAAYLHSPIELPLGRVLPAAAAAVAPGGRLLVLGHAALPPRAGHHDDVSFPSVADILAEIALAPADWQVEVADIWEREATGRNGVSGTLSDSVVLARRHCASVG